MIIMFKKTLLFNEKGLEVNIELNSPGAFTDPYFLTFNEMKFIQRIKEYFVLTSISNKRLKTKERNEIERKIKSILHKINMVKSVEKISNRDNYCFKYTDDFYEGRKLVVFIKTNDKKENIGKIIRVLRVLSYPLQNKVDTITKYF